MAKRKYLIVIDDENEFAEFVVDVATASGYEAIAAANARQFRELYAARIPDVVVCDIIMPGTDGIEIIRWLMERNCPAHILIASGYGLVYAHAAKALGESDGKLSIDILRKPVKVSTLRDFLNRDSGKADCSAA
jgi:DNA-binding NtrC family response regulator